MVFIRLSGIVALLTFFAFYPYLPGEYDPLAVALSLVAQALVLAGLLFVPIGAAWLMHRALAGRARTALHPRRRASAVMWSPR